MVELQRWPARSGRPPGRMLTSLITLLAAGLVLAGCSTAGAADPTASSPAADSTAADSTAADSTAPDSAAAGPDSASTGEPTGSAATTAPTEAPTGSAGIAGTAPGPAAPTLTPTVVALAPGVSDEASGIATSTGTPGAYFLIDDGTGTDSVAAVGSDGALLARIAVDGMSAGNAEALGYGSCGPSPLPNGTTADTCLYVGDIGDNAESRSDIAVYRFAEPDLSSPPADPVPADEWRYSYPDGPHNAEGMLVDTDGSLLIVTKPPAQGGLPHRMYRAEPGGGMLTFLREFSVPPATRPFKTLFTGNVVTDLATAPGGVLLLTYDDIQEYMAPDPAAPLSSFPDWPHRPLPVPGLPQAEGITAMTGGCGYAVASEAGPGGKAGSLGLVSCS